MNILLIDDDEIDRLEIKRSLKRGPIQCEVVEAETADEGLTHLATSKFDLVLLDYMMPVKRGIDLLEDIKEVDPDHQFVIIMISNWSNEELSVQCIKAGAHDFILKSEVDGQKLWRIISHALTRHEVGQGLYNDYLEFKALAERDHLTKLANRYKFEESTNDLINQANRCEGRPAILLFDIDRFKSINDTHGHDIGDQVLLKLTEKVKRLLRKNELFARLGGDEFAIVIPQYTNISSIVKLAQRLLKNLDTSFSIGTLQIKVSISIGIAIYQDACRTLEDILKSADIALYRSKEKGRNQLTFFDEPLQKTYINRNRLEDKLKRTFSDGQIHHLFQPIFLSETKRLVGFESKITFPSNDPDFSSAEFISVLKDSSLMIDIGYWEIKKALYTLATWHQLCPEQLTMSLHLTSRQLTDHSIVAFMKKQIDQNQLEPGCIRFVVSEEALNDREDEKFMIIHELHDIGVLISLDNFGMGTSAISLLRSYPFTNVGVTYQKCEPSEEQNISFLEGLTTMLHAMNFHCTMKNVMQLEELNLCTHCGVEYVQGDYLSPPLQKAEIEKRFLLPFWDMNGETGAS